MTFCWCHMTFCWCHIHMKLYICLFIFPPSQHDFILLLQRRFETLAQFLLLLRDHAAPTNDAQLAPPCISDQWRVTNFDQHYVREKEWELLRDPATLTNIARPELEWESKSEREIGERGSDLTKREGVMKGRERERDRFFCGVYFGNFTRT